MCQSLTQYQGMLTEPRQVKGERKTEIKDTKPPTL